MGQVQNFTNVRDPLNQNLRTGFWASIGSQKGKTANSATSASGILKM
jgi:hypothetical protein